MPILEMKIPKSKIRPLRWIRKKTEQVKLNLKTFAVTRKLIREISQENWEYQPQKRDIKSTIKRFVGSDYGYVGGLSEPANLRLSNYEMIKTNISLIFNNKLQKFFSIQPMVGPVCLAYNMTKTGEELYDNGNMKKLGLEVKSMAVEARPHKLQYTLKFEPSTYSSEKHVSFYDSGAFTNAYYREMLSYKLIDILNEVTPTKLPDSNISEFILKEAESLGENKNLYLIVGSETLVKIHDSSNSTRFTPDGLNAENIGGAIKVGKLDNIELFHLENAPKDFKAILISRGKTRVATDDIIICPYTPMMSTGVVMNPETMEPMIGFITRNGHAYPEGWENQYRVFE